MKYLLSITVCIILVFAGCTGQINEVESIDYSSLSIQELANEISKDSIYLELNKKTMSHFDNIKKFVRDQETSAFKALTKDKILNQLGLNEEYWEQRKTAMMEKTDHLNSKFGLDERSEEEVKQLFNLLYKNSISQNTLNKISDCKAQFEDDISEAHANYDSAIFIICPMIAIFTGSGGAGYSACAAGAVYKAVVEVGQAIDDYNACMKK